MIVTEKYKILPEILVYNLSKPKTTGVFKLSANKKYYYNPNTKGIKFTPDHLFCDKLTPIWYSLFNFIKL